LRREGAEHGILATAVCPACVRTPLVESQVPPGTGAHGMPDERVLEEVILAPQAAKRLLEPAEVADTVAYLLGPGRRAFTGAAVTMGLGGALAEPPSNEAVDLPALEALWGFNHPESEKIPPQEGANSRALRRWSPQTGPCVLAPCLGFEDGVGVGHDHEAG
jgi:hypothetical protein